VSPSHVITEISSAQGDKNSASSTQKNSHSWHKVKFHSTEKGSKLYKMTKKLQGALHPLGARARAQHLRTWGAYARLWGAKPARLPNGAFMELVGLPTTNGSAPKSI
jgi:hypothetical protein